MAKGTWLINRNSLKVKQGAYIKYVGGGPEGFTHFSKQIS